MKFIHQDEDFGALLDMVATDTGISPALVEKDYWVVHALWAVHQASFEVWFKGGTSLSKGFGLIQRFSEDLDLKLVARDSDGAGAVAVPEVNWTVTKPSARQVQQRQAWYRWLAATLEVPDCTVALDEDRWSFDRHARGGDLQVRYPGRHVGQLGLHNLPYVKLELGDARVTPFVLRPVTSFVHEALLRLGQLSDFRPNLPGPVRHVHPWVTLVEKLTILARKYGDPRHAAAGFVRHYEDAARIAEVALEPPPGYTLDALIAEMVTSRTVPPLPDADHPALTLSDPARRAELQAAYDDLADMYWAPRQPLQDACDTLRAWLAKSGAEKR